jgi:two-component system phosphate regulon sensor histidine kinase PhoR
MDPAILLYWAQHPIFVSVLSFSLGFFISMLIWQSRKRRVMKNLEKLLLNEEKEFKQAFNPKARVIEEGFRGLFIARKQELQRLQQLENYRRNYIGNVAHELKTPLFSIQGYIESVLEDPDIDKETLTQFLNKANKNADRLGQIVNDLDAITKFESGMLAIEKDTFNIQDLITEVCEELEIQASQKEIHLEHISDSAENLVYADRVRIRQILVNLGFNSIKYGKQKGKTTYHIKENEKQLIIEVTDNGIGIPEESLGRIFERFYRVDSHRSRDKGGSGLGLSIVKHIIEAHGEHIEVSSVEGEGSTFTFTLSKS